MSFNQTYGSISIKFENLMKEVVKLLGIYQTNTPAYNPQTDGLVEQFNCTVTTMLAKTAKKGDNDWNKQMLCTYAFFAYEASEQQST